MSDDITQEKIDAEKLFDCSNMFDFVSSIVRNVPYEGSSMSLFYICEYNNVQFLTKIYFYRKSYFEVYSNLPKNIITSGDADIKILQLLREKITDKNLTYCILELVYYKVCEGVSTFGPSEKTCENLVNRAENLSIRDGLEQYMCRYLKLVKNGLAYDKCAFLVLDKCDLNLGEYLRGYIETPINFVVFKSILFQIIHAFYIITTVYPEFHHYDLHTGNVLLKFDPNYKFKSNNVKFLSYNVGGRIYIVPYFGIIPKIIDFEFSSLPEENIISSAAVDKVQMYYRSRNDLLFLFYWIDSDVVRQHGIDKVGKMRGLLNKLEPNESYINYDTEHIRMIEDKIPTYEQMMQNDVWNDYRNVKVPKTQIYNEFAQPAQ
jgi:hypothetical protein